MLETTRTQEEIRARIDKCLPDFLGEMTVAPLLAYAEYDTVVDLLKDPPTKEEWDSDQQGEEDIVGMFSHACDKAANHRGISASIGHARAINIAWLFTDDAFTEEVADLEYANYGAGALRAVAKRLGGRFQEAYDKWNANDMLTNMAQGAPCWPGCEDGCGQ